MSAPGEEAAGRPRKTKFALINIALSPATFSVFWMLLLHILPSFTIVDPSLSLTSEIECSPNLKRNTHLLALASAEASLTAGGAIFARDHSNCLIR